MLRNGRVVGKEENGKLSVCFERPEMCAKCGACMGRKHDTLVTVQGEAEIGDTVDVELADAKVVKASVIAYLVPLIGLIAGLIISAQFTSDEIMIALFGVLGLAAAWLVQTLIDRSLQRKKTWQPRLVAVHKEENNHAGNHGNQG